MEVHSRDSVFTPDLNSNYLTIKALRQFFTHRLLFDVGYSTLSPMKEGLSTPQARLKTALFNPQEDFREKLKLVLTILTGAAAVDVSDWPDVRFNFK